MEIAFSIQWILILLSLIFWYVVLPGAVLVTLFNFDRGTFKSFTLFFPIGIIFFAFLSFIGYLVTLTVDQIGTIIAVSNVFGITFLIVKVRNSRFAITGYHDYKESPLSRDLFLIGLTTICIFTISLFAEWYPRGDGAIHLQGIQNLLIKEQLVFPFYSLIGNPIIPDHTYDAYYVLVALLKKRSGLPLDIVWHYLTPIFSLFVPMVFYYLSRKLTNDRRLVQVFIFLFFICVTLFPGLLNATFTDALVYPNRLYFFVLLPVLLGSALAYLNSGSIKHLVLSMLCINTFFFIHQSGYLFSLLLLGGAFVFHLFCGKNQSLFRRFIILLLALIGTSAPLLLLKLSSNLEFILKASDDVWKSHYRFSIFSENLYAFPISRYGKWGMVLALFIMLFIFITQRKRSKRTILMNSLLTASILVPLFIVFNPFIVPYLGKLISYPAIGRMLRLPLYYFIFGYGLYLVATKSSIAKWQQRIPSNLKLFSISFCLVLITWKQTSGRRIVHKFPSVRTIAEHIPPDSIVYSDKLTCTDIAEFQQVTVPLIQFNGPIDLVPIDEEKKEALLFFSGKSDAGYIRSILKKYKVEFVVLQNTENAVGPKSILDKLLDITFQNEMYILYRVS